MARPKPPIPKFYQAANGRYFTKIDNKTFWLGSNQEAARLKYAELLRTGSAEKCSSVESKSPPVILVSELCLRFMTEHAIPRFKRHDGKATAEVACYRCAFAILAESFGNVPACDFGPNKLRALRDLFVRAGWCRRWCNKQVSRVRSLFRFGVSIEAVPSSVLDALKSLPALKEGETDARETKRRTAVSDVDLEKVRQLLRPQHRDAFDLLLLTGARPGELLEELTPDLIDKSGEVWKAELPHHKNSWRGQRRVLYFNQAAQKIIAPYLEAFKPGRLLFGFRRTSFSNLIQNVCRRAGVAKFVPHQLRHCTATRLVDLIGIEAAQRMLGHNQVAMTEHYSRLSDELALKAAKSLDR